MIAWPALQQARLFAVSVLGSFGVGLWMGPQPTLAAQSVRFMTGEALYAMASSSEDTAQSSARSYVLGVLDGLMHLRDAKICIGVDVPADSVYGLVIQTLTQRPDLRRYNAASLVREIVSSHYPCA
ncbi:MAG: Rap1a/Tai family immunity protein [Burkholderiaceae bacterium]